MKLAVVVELAVVFIVEKSSITVTVTSPVFLSTFTSAPAIAVYVADMLKEMGLELKENKNFNPQRKIFKAFVNACIK